MGLISDLFGGPDAPKQRDIDQTSGKAEEGETARLRGIMKQMFWNDEMNEGDEFQGAAQVQFGSDALDKSGSVTGVEQAAGAAPQFEWTKGRMDKRQSHQQAYDWLSENGSFEEHGMSQKDAQWIGKWLQESNQGEHHYLFSDDFSESEWNWDEKINETNQTRLRNFQAMYDAYAPQLI